MNSNICGEWTARESACENEKFKLEKQFMILKKENYFTEIKECFPSQLKRISVWPHFSVVPNNENYKNIFQKNFYVETNRVWSKT
jgi:hypothetical protein